MKYNGRKPYRRSIRLKNYDYTQPNAYFITVCTQNRACFFGEIVADELNATTAAEIVLAEWHALPKRFANVQIDAFVIMPNHIHGILWILPTDTQTPTKPDAINRIPTHRQPTVEAQFIAPSSTQEPAKPDAMNRIPTLGDILRTFKSAATRRIRQQGFSDFAWQSNYYEHIIRNETSLANV